MKKILLYIGLALLAVIIAGFILLGRYAGHLVDPYIRSLLETTRPMGHRIDYEKIRINLFAKTILLKDVRMFADSITAENKMRIDLRVKDIRLTGFRIWEFLFKKTLNITDIIIENPEVKIFIPAKATDVVEEVAAEKPPKTGQQLLKHINLGRIILSNGSFQLIQNDSILASSPDINFLLQDIDLEKNSKDEPVGFTYGDYEIYLTNINLNSETALYVITLEKFSARKDNLTITLNGLNIAPKYNKKEFSRKLPFQNDRFELKIKEIEITHTGLKKILDKQPLEITMLLIDSLNADIYRDKNVAFNFNRFPVYYNESFLKIGIPLVIDTVMITNSRINYGELAAGNAEAGNITLENFELQSYGLTTTPEDDSIEQVMQLNVQAKVMGEGNMDVKLILPLEGDYRAIRCYGSVGAMNLVPLNAMLAPSINMKFNGGRVQRMTFDFTANDNSSKGWMEFLYSDLDVELLKKDPDKQWGFVSLLANAMAVSNNPDPKNKLKVVEIGYERDKNKGIINYVWKTIQSGMVRTILPMKKYQINRGNADQGKSQGNSEGKKTKKKEKKE